MNTHVLSKKNSEIHTKSLATELLLWAVGVMFVALLAQLTIPLPWTPVPITGQTFGVALMALLFGRNRSLAVMTAYLLIGGLGAPVFSAGTAGLELGPTVGYLFGMSLGALVIGELADRGARASWLGAFFAAACGSVITFTFGVAVLALYLEPTFGLTKSGAHGPTLGALMTMGVLPFLPGDFLKNALAATIATGSQTFRRRKHAEGQSDSRES